MKIGERKLRKDARHGDCFRFTNPPDRASFRRPQIALDESPSSAGVILPDGWGWVGSEVHNNQWADFEIEGIAPFYDCETAVRCGFPRPAETEEVEPVIRSCVDPMDKLLSRMADGLTGQSCLDLFVHGMHEEGMTAMTIDQRALAREIWSEELRRLREESSRAELCRVVVDQDLE